MNCSLFAIYRSSRVCFVCATIGTKSFLDRRSPSHYVSPWMNMLKFLRGSGQPSPSKLQPPIKQPPEKQPELFAFRKVSSMFIICTHTYVVCNWTSSKLHQLRLSYQKSKQMRIDTHTPSVGALAFKSVLPITVILEVPIDFSCVYVGNVYYFDDDDLYIMYRWIHHSQIHTRKT